MVTVPLKGRRRALGTLVMEEVRLEPGSQIDLLERADEIGRQLAAAVENVLLLDAVLRSRRELENTFNSLADLVAVSDQEGRLVYMNGAFLERIGKTRQELIDRPLADVVGPATNALIRSANRTRRRPPAHRRRPSSVDEVEDSKLRGTFLVTLTPLLGEERESMGIVLVARDVTPHAELEAERAELRNRLVQSEKLAALGQFVAGIAHELNNPLQGVLGHLELLRATARFPRRCAATCSAFIARPIAPRRSSATCSSSRDRDGSCAGARASTPRCRACSRCARRRSARPTSRSCAGTADGLPRVKGDPLLLQQALLNIVLNAEQAIGAAGGRIETTTSVRGDRRRPRRSSCRFGTPARAFRRRRCRACSNRSSRRKKSGKGPASDWRLRMASFRNTEDRLSRRTIPTAARCSLCGFRWKPVVFVDEMPTMDDTFLTTEEVLAYLQVNLRTVYRLIKAGKIPAVRVGRQWRFRKRDIDAWLDSQRPRGGARAPPAPATRRFASPRQATERPRILVVDDESSIRDLLAKTLALAEYDVDTAPTAARRSSGCACIPTIS